MSEPRLLLLETSGKRGLVGVAVGERLGGVHALDEGRRHARDLAPAVARLLHGQGWGAKQLDAVVVSRGPGSYTGLRVGLMSAKALAYATGCAVLAIDTFAVVARQAPPGCDRVEVIADAQQQSVYAQPFARAPAGWRSTAELTIRPFEEWLADRDPHAWVTGPGLAKWHARLPADLRLVDEAAREPGVESLLALGLERYRADQRDDLFALEPLYLRPSSAEQQWRGR
jgi:tRNA threonylcarbamoyladenosine biosynthesis protein TsaB